MGKYVFHPLPFIRRLDYSIRYNGFGGKVEPGETPLNAATRELEVGSTTWAFTQPVMCC